MRDTHWDLLDEYNEVSLDKLDERVQVAIRQFFRLTDPMKNKVLAKCGYDGAVNESKVLEHFEMLSATLELEPVIKDIEWILSYDN